MFAAVNDLKERERENKKVWLIIKCSASFVKAGSCGKVKQGLRNIYCLGIEAAGAQVFFQLSVDNHKKFTLCTLQEMYII